VVHTLPLSGNFEQYPLKIAIKEPAALIAYPLILGCRLIPLFIGRLLFEKGAYLAMKLVYEHYYGKKFNAPLPVECKGSVKAIHYIQSFDPQDNVSPELVHRIAKAFARKHLGAIVNL